MSEEARKPHLRAVPPARTTEERVAHREPSEPVAHAVEEVSEALGVAEQARDGGSPLPAPPARVLSGLGSTQEGFGTAPTWLVHVGTTTGAAASGALVGGLSAGSWRGAQIGGLVNVSLVGLAASLLGAGRLGTLPRILYGVLAVAAGAGAGYLVWRRMR